MLCAVTLAAGNADFFFCHSTPHHDHEIGCVACSSHLHCDTGAHCWPDGVCRLNVPFHLHIHQDGATLVDGRRITVDVVPSDPDHIGAVHTEALEMCACASSRHRTAEQSDNNVGHTVVALDRQHAQRTGCHTPVSNLMHRHYALSDGAVIAALVDPQNNYYCEVTLRYTAPPGPYVPPGLAAEDNAVYVVRYTVTDETLRLRIECAPGAFFHPLQRQCIASSDGLLGEVWFEMYIAGCMAASILLGWVCRLRQRVAQQKKMNG